MTSAQSDRGSDFKSRVDPGAERELTVISTHRIGDDDSNSLSIAEELRPHVVGARHDDQVVDRGPKIRQRDLEEVRVIDADRDGFDSQGQVLFFVTLPITFVDVPSVPALASIRVPISEQSVLSIAKTT